MCMSYIFISSCLYIFMMPSSMKLNEIHTSLLLHLILKNTNSIWNTKGAVIP